MVVTSIGISRSRGPILGSFFNLELASAPCTSSISSIRVVRQPNVVEGGRRHDGDEVNIDRKQRRRYWVRARNLGNKREKSTGYEGKEVSLPGEASGSTGKLEIAEDGDFGVDWIELGSWK